MKSKLRFLIPIFLTVAAGFALAWLDTGCRTTSYVDSAGKTNTVSDLDTNIVRRLTPAIKAAGTLAVTVAHSQDKNSTPYFAAAIGAIDTFILQSDLSADGLRMAFKNSSAKELKGDIGQAIAGGLVVLYASFSDQLTVKDRPGVIQLATGLRDGLKAGVDQYASP